MSASTLLTRLKEAGVTVAVADGQLKLKGPKSVLNEDVLTELRAIKAELIKLLSAASTSDAASTIAEWRAAINAVRSDRTDIVQLKRESLRFLGSPDAITAVENGWDGLSLFGMHEGECPRERVDCWGLVLFLAWGIHKCTVQSIEQKVCALRTRSGAVQTLRCNRANFDQAVPWWEHSGIMNANSVNSEDMDHAS